VSKNVEAGAGAYFDLREQGLTRQIYSSVGDPKFPEIWKTIGGLVVTEEFADKYPDIVKRIVKVHVKAAKWGSEEENREELYKLWAKVGTPYSNIREGYRGYSLKSRNSPLLDEYFITKHKEVVDFAKENGFIKKTFDVEQWIDKSYLEAALKELGLENYWPRFDKDGKEIK
jgi:sulfonate transport system substrate-binding protein